jgi:phosphonate transport system permease protein
MNEPSSGALAARTRSGLAPVVARRGDTLVGDLAAAESWKRTDPARRGRSRRGPRWRQPDGDRSGPSLRRIAAGAWLILLALCIGRVVIGRGALVNGRGLAEFREFFGAALRPRLDAEMLRITWRASIITVAYAVVGTILAGVIGVVGGIIVSTQWRRRPTGRSARTLAGRAVRAAVRLLLVPMRGIHEAIWALLLLNVLGLDPMVAVLALAIPFGAITARVFAGLLDAVPRGQAEALRSAGATETAAFFYGVLPTALADLFSYLFYRFECSVRSVAVLGVIGAGGLGYELSLSFQSTLYPEIWTLLYALIAISGAADFVSTRVRRARARGQRHRPTLRRNVVIALGVVGATWWAWWVIDADVSTLWSQRSRLLWKDLWRQWLPPDLSRAHLLTLWRVTLDTVAISVVSITASLAAAMPIAYLAARRPGRRRAVQILSWLSRLILLVARAIPPSVWAFVAVIVLFSGSLPAAVALAVYNFGVLGRLLAEVAENLDPRPADALRQLGASPSGVLAYSVLPRTIGRFLGYGLYRWEVAVRETIVVGIAAAGGLGMHIKQRLAAFDYPEVAAAVLAFVVLTVLIDLASSGFRRAIGATT